MQKNLWNLSSNHGQKLLGTTEKLATNILNAFLKMFILKTEEVASYMVEKKDCRKDSTPIRLLLLAIIEKNPGSQQKKRRKEMHRPPEKPKQNINQPRLL